MKNITFKSNADEIRYHVRGLLSDNREHELQEIKKHVENKSGKRFTSGNYAGALRDLIAKEDYFSPKRGVYKKGVSINCENCDSYDLSMGIKELLVKFYNELYNEIGKLNILDASDEDSQIAKEAKNILEYLKEKSEEF